MYIITILTIKTLNGPLLNRKYGTEVNTKINTKTKARHILKSNNAKINGPCHYTLASKNPDIRQKIKWLDDIRDFLLSVWNFQGLSPWWTHCRYYVASTLSWLLVLTLKM